MPKPDSSCSCDFPPVRETVLMGTPLKVKSYICSRDGGPYREKPDKVRLQLTILAAEECDAHCPFCIAGQEHPHVLLDPGLLPPVLERLRDEEAVRGVSITGGEPCLHMDRLDSIIRMVFDILGPDIQVTLNTNGAGITGLGALRDLLKIDAIHISRHHWLDAVNDRVFGRKMATDRSLGEALRSVGCPDLFVLNCILLRGAVETPEDAHRYMDFAIECGAGKVSFITATAVNAWTKEHRVPFDDVLKDDDPQLLFTRAYQDYTWCRCRDGVYASPEGRLIEFYGRHTESGGCDYCRGMVIGTDGVLRAGFGKDAPVLWQPGRH